MLLAPFHSPTLSVSTLSSWHQVSLFILGLFPSRMKFMRACASGFVSGVREIHRRGTVAACCLPSFGAAYPPLPQPHRFPRR